MNPDRLAELEDERRFLLRSLRDLDAEYAAGDVETEDYVTLRDGYTKRAAGVLQAIEAGRATRAARPPARWGRRLGVVALVALLAVGAGWLVARSSGQRLAGQEITGGSGRGDLAGLLAQARALLNVDPLAARSLYDEVLAERPEHPEALTYGGWLLFTASRQASADVGELAVDAAEEQLRRAVRADPRYPDPHCFLAVIAANARDDVATARAEIDTCLELGPPADVRRLVEGFAERLDAPATSAADGGLGGG